MTLGWHRNLGDPSGAIDVERCADGNQRTVVYYWEVIAAVVTHFKLGHGLKCSGLIIFANLGESDLDYSGCGKPKWISIPGDHDGHGLRASLG